jgi:DNA-binding NarL/FixJ family response regulator
MAENTPLTSTPTMLGTLYHSPRRLDYPLDAITEIYGLRPSEVKVLDLILCGLTGPQVANKLCVAPSTVKTHMRALFEKFDVSNKVELVSTVFAASRTVLS